MEEVTVPYSSVLSVRLAESLGFRHKQKGGHVSRELVFARSYRRQSRRPEGAAVQGKVVEVQNAGRLSGKAMLSLELSRLRYKRKYL